MTLDYRKLMAHQFPLVEQTYTERDSMLYALSVGFGRDPLREPDLPYVFERDLRAAPTMAVALCFRSMREAQLGVDYTRVVHGEHLLRLHASLPAAATVVCHTRIAEVIDRGAGKGALLFIERVISDKHSGVKLATSTMSAFCRGDGGFGGPVTTLPAAHPIPGRAPDAQFTIDLPANAALLYRLSGDFNPLHADPQFAARAGFERPILHGLQVYGEIGRILLQEFAGNDPARFQEMACRFTGTVFPGDTLTLHCWREDGAISFRALAHGRPGAVIDNGRAVVRA